MKEPTKADLAAAVAKLTEENAGLRDLLAAVSDVARTAPIAAVGEPDYKRDSRMSSILSAVGVVTDPKSTWTWSWGVVSTDSGAAAFLRRLAAEPPGYEVYVEAQDDELHAPPVITDGEHDDIHGCTLEPKRCKVPQEHGMPHCWCNEPEHHREPEPARPVFEVDHPDEADGFASAELRAVSS